MATFVFMMAISVLCGVWKSIFFSHNHMCFLNAHKKREIYRRYFVYMRERKKWLLPQWDPCIIMVDVFHNMRRPVCALNGRFICKWWNWMCVYGCGEFGVSYTAHNGEIPQYICLACTQHLDQDNVHIFFAIQHLSFI